MPKLAEISGTVKKHLGRGKRLGYPTANLDTTTDLMDGIYLGLVKKIDGGTLPPLFLRKLLPQKNLFSPQIGLPALVFVGPAVTFDETKKLIEVHILDFSQEIYGAQMKVEVIKKIRDNQKFDNEATLVAQMKEDERIAREFFSKATSDR